MTRRGAHIRYPLDTNVNIFKMASDTHGDTICAKLHVKYPRCERGAILCRYTGLGSTGTRGEHSFNQSNMRRKLRSTFETHLVITTTAEQVAPQNIIERLRVAFFTANGRFTLRISHNRRKADKNCPEQFSYSWIKLA